MMHFAFLKTSNVILGIYHHLASHDSGPKDDPKRCLDPKNPSINLKKSGFKDVRRTIFSDSDIKGPGESWNESLSSTLSQKKKNIPRHF